MLASKTMHELYRALSLWSQYRAKIAFDFEIIYLFLDSRI